MNKAGKVTLITISTIGALVGGYFIVKKIKEKKEQDDLHTENSKGSSYTPPVYNAPSVEELKSKEIFCKGVVATETSALRLRNSKSTANTSNVICVMPKGAEIEVLKWETDDKDWLCVKFGENYGYASRNYITLKQN